MTDELFAFKKEIVRELDSIYFRLGELTRMLQTDISYEEKDRADRFLNQRPKTNNEKLNEIKRLMEIARGDNSFGDGEILGSQISKNDIKTYEE